MRKNQKFVLPSSASPFLEKIIETSYRMRTLIEELLEFSRISKHNNKYELVDLQQIVKSLLPDLERVIHEKKAKIKIGKLPSVEAVPIQMHQLFLNLISNALKFSKKGVSPVIQVTTHRVSAKDVANYSLNPSLNYTEIIVSDNGIGFPENLSEKIFEIFHRLNHRQSFPGTGIGLALCRKIVNHHHGKIFAQSNEEDGSEFHIILPHVNAKG